MTKILLTGTGSVMGLSIYDVLTTSELTKKTPLILLNSLDVSAPGLRSKRYRKEDLFLVSPEAKDSRYKEFVINLINQQKIEIVYPGTQHELGKLSDLRDLGYPMASPGSKVVNLCSDKLLLSEYMISKKIAHPKTWLLSTFMNTSRGDAKFIVKPRSGSASRGIQVLDKFGVEKFATSISNPESWIVQEYLNGNEYTCSVYRDRVTHLVNTLVMQRELSPDGASISGVVEHSEVINAYLAEVVDALVEYGWDYGNLNIQLRTSDSGVSLFEINPRLSSTESPKAKMGFDTVSAYYQNLVLGQASNLVVPKAGTSFLRYYSDIVYSA
jgi:carbamoyl-phosphate synthase large subunit